MAKGDHAASANKIDEQQTQSQSYLTGIQGNLGNQYGRNDALYWGSGAPTYGTINNMGSTVPNYSPTGGTGLYPGNTSGSPVPNSPQMNGGASISDPYGEFQSAVNALGIQPQGFRGNTQEMDAVTNYLNQQYPGQNWTNGGTQAGDFMGYGTSGQGLDVLPAGDANWQNLADSSLPGGGGGMGNYGAGGIPGMAIGDYQNIQNLYGQMLPQYQGLFNQLSGQYGSMIGAASNMAQTGGLSDTDKAAMRSRAISPIRSVYSQGLQNLDRQKSIQGGYSPGYTTALGRFNRDMGQQTSDATTNAEASIAQLVQQGKLGGLSAWGSGLSGESSGLLGALGGQNQAIGGMAGMYGQTPGLANFFAGQLENSNRDQLAAAGLQDNLSNDIMKNQIAASSIPGNYQDALNNVLGTGKAASMIAGGASPIMDYLNSHYGNNVPPGPNGQNYLMKGGTPNDDGSSTYLMPGGQPEYPPPLPGEVYGGSTPVSPYNGGYDIGTGGGGGGYGGSTVVPNYGTPPPEYNPDDIYPWLGY